jgi:hypothetical protein
MPSKLSAEERQLWEDAIIKERVGYSDGPIRFEVTDDPAVLAREERQHRARLKFASDDEVLLEGYNLGLRRVEVIGPSLFEQEQSPQTLAQTGGRARADQRRQIKLKKIKEGQRLLAEHPMLRAQQIYDRLGLHEGIIKFTSFERRWLPEIRKKRQTLAG